MIEILPANSQHIQELSALLCSLWPHLSKKEALSELNKTLKEPESIFYLAFHEKEAVGFAQSQLRHDYVEGCETSPVGYLEGIFVKHSYRHQGIARSLLTKCEQWALSKGCQEFASDCELGNEESLSFHLKSGFQEANRIICFTKSLKE